MKKTVIIFPRATYTSNGDGSARSYVSRDELRRVCGQGKSIRFQVLGYRRSTNAQVQVKMWETASPDQRPSEVIPNGTPFFTGTAHTTLTPAPETITGPFCENVEFTIEVAASTGSVSEEWDGEVAATLILEE